MNPRTVQLLGVCVVLAISSIAAAEPSEKKQLSPWNKRVLNEIGSRWYRDIEKDPNLVAVGTARISFRITPSGRVGNLRITSNTSNNYFANVCLRAIQEAKLPPIPQSVLREANKKWIDVDIPFTLFPPGK